MGPAIQSRYCRHRGKSNPNVWRWMRWYTTGMRVRVTKSQGMAWISRNKMVWKTSRVMNARRKRRARKLAIYLYYQHFPPVVRLSRASPDFQFDPPVRQFPWAIQVLFTILIAIISVSDLSIEVHAKFNPVQPFFQWGQLKLPFHCKSTWYGNWLTPIIVYSGVDQFIQLHRHIDHCNEFLG